MLDWIEPHNAGKKKRKWKHQNDEGVESDGR